LGGGVFKYNYFRPLCSKADREGQDIMNLRELVVKLKCLPRLTALAVYILIGAAIFVKLEKTEEPNEVVANRILKVVQERISLQFGINITDQEFMSVVDNITEAAVIRARPDWTFWRAFDFSFISLTTIGSPIGQGVFIIYALIGLPLTMVTLKYTGKLPITKKSRGLGTSLLEIM